MTGMVTRLARDLPEEEKEEVKKSTKTLKALTSSVFRAILREKRGDGVITPEEIKDPVTGLIREYQISDRESKHLRELREHFFEGPEVTREHVLQCHILDRCKAYKEQGRYVDPRTFPGLAKLFGGKKALDEACKLEGL